ncbi:MAG: SEC-C domain-containing protein [Arenicella sp.]|nr:SEC-C domain-containing protein [Arenicella sp.]
MLDRVKTEVVTVLAKVQLREESEVDELERRQQKVSQAGLELQHADASATRAEAPQQAQEPATFIRDAPKVGRNEACPCGSGKKYKQCHGKLK